MKGVEFACAGVFLSYMPICMSFLRAVVPSSTPATSSGDADATHAWFIGHGNLDRRTETLGFDYTLSRDWWKRAPLVP